MAGSFTTQEVLDWFKGVQPTGPLKTNVVDVPPQGNVRHEFLRRFGSFSTPKDEEGSNNYEEDDDDIAASIPYTPQYNLKPDDQEAFKDFGPGNTINPLAKPGDSDYGVDQSTDVYNDFSFEMDSNPRLPIHEYREEILNAIEGKKVTVIQGSTGSGKSTQIPQFILEEHASSRRHCNIICTQPRRIAAKSVAKYVSDCRGWKLGTLVGYQIGMDKNVSESTRVTFVTTGVLLEKLVNMRNMNQFTHIVLDEVHERDKETDFCLLIVRKLLMTNSPHVKVILMSATFETAYFASYFSMPTPNGISHPPVIKVEASPHPVHVFYLDDIKRIGRCEPMDADYPRVNQSCMTMVVNLLRDFDVMEESDPMYGKGNFVPGTVLVFLPGLPEIMQMKDMLGDPSRLTKLMLHSTISWEEQSRVFHPPEPGKRKVILATNIAESSITVPDIKYVIDFCLVKQMMCDWATKYCCLRTVWASKASLDQRKGRAGRVSSGRCYRLITSDFLSQNIQEYSVPEMQRCPIETIVLKCKKLNMGEPRSTLRLALQAPSLADIEMAIMTLKEVGAVTTMIDGAVNPFDGNLTFVGMIMEGLPINVRLGKLVILGHAFGCLESCLVIAAALSLKSFFVRPVMDELTGYRSKKSWDENSSSDCLAILSAYKVWSDMKSKGGFTQVRNAEYQWCRRHYLQMGLLKEVAELVRELTKRLERFNIKPTRVLYRSHEDPAVETLILKVVLCGAFYPNYFLWREIDEELSLKHMSGHDPSTTVMLHGLPDGPIKYADQLCAIFGVCGKGKKIYFEAHKAFLEFARPVASRSTPMGISLPVLDSVYLALQLGRRRLKPSLCLIDKKSSSSRQPLPSARNNGDEEGDCDGDIIPQLKLPDSGTHQIFVTSIIDAGHFWAQYSDLKTNIKLKELMKNISKRPLDPLILDPQKMMGVFCLARFSVDGLFYRAKVVDLDIKNQWAQVMFIDYGNTEWVPFDGLCKLNQAEKTEPGQAFESFLSGVKPNLKWSEKAGMRLQQLTADRHLMADVYSLVEGVLRVELYDTNQEDDILINAVLVQEGHAIKCDEPYRSRLANAQAKSLHASQAAASSLLRSAMDLNLPEGHVTKEMGKLGISSKSVDWFHGSVSASGPKLPLKGPSSPYEVSFSAMTVGGNLRSVRVQNDSINSVVINNEPQDKHARMMVAGQVILNPSGNTCLARDTTLLPAISGLVHIMCLLFAPTVEMRCDELKRQYTGALCGLGFDPVSMECIYPEHDMEVTFDTLFTQKDLNQINRIRTALNMTMDSEDALAQWGEHAIKKIQKNIRELISELILPPRTSVPPYSCNLYGWNQVAPDDILYVNPEEEGEEEDLVDHAYMYPVHNGILISEERIDLQRPTKVLLMREAVKELRRKIANNTEAGPLECALCRYTSFSVREMKEHLYSNDHYVKERNLFSDDLDKDIYI